METKNQKSTSTMTLPELVEQLRSDNFKKKDMIVPANNIRMKDGCLIVSGKEQTEISELLGELGISETDAGNVNMTLAVTEIAHAQIGAKLDITKSYYDRMKTKSVPLLDTNVSHWMSELPSNLLLRTFIDKEEKNGFCRAVLSDRYNMIDHYDVLLATLEAIKESGVNLQIQQCDLTDKKMYISFVCPEIEVQAKELVRNYKVPNGSPMDGNVGVVTGFVIGNSEIGLGSFFIAPRATVLACRNGLTFSKDAFSKVHLGSKLDALESTIKWSSKTKEKNYELVCSQVGDAVKTFCSADYLTAKVHELVLLGGKEVTNKVDVIKNVSKEFSYDKPKEEKLLEYFLGQNDTTAFGVVQALTLYAHRNTKNADEQYEMEDEAMLVLNHMGRFDTEFKEKSPKKTFSKN